MPAIFLLNPSGQRRPNYGTSAGAKAGWVKRKAKYQQDDGYDRPDVPKLHRTGHTVRQLRRMTGPQIDAIGLPENILEGLGFGKGSTRRPNSSRKRKNAWFHNTEGHSVAATKKWNYKRAAEPGKPVISYYDLVADLGIPKAALKYEELLAAGDESYSDPRTKPKYGYANRQVRRKNEGKSMARRKTRSRKTVKRRKNTSAKRKRAGKKAAATRKRKKAVRVRAGKKAARTRKRNSAKRSSARRKPVKRRRRRNTSAPKRKSSKRAAASRKGWRKRRRKNTTKTRKVTRRRRKRAAPKRRRRNTSVGRRLARRPKRRRRRRKNPSGLVGRLMSALPTMGDLKDAGWLGGGLLGVGIAVNALQSNSTVAKYLGKGTTAAKFYVPEVLVTVLGSAAVTMLLKSKKRGKQVMLGGLLNILFKGWNRYVRPMASLPAALKADPLGSMVTFGRESMGSYVQFPASGGMGDYVQFAGHGPVNQAARLPAYQPAPFDVGMPMGEYEDVSGYYGVTAY